MWQLDHMVVPSVQATQTAAAYAVIRGADMTLPNLPQAMAEFDSQLEAPPEPDGGREMSAKERALRQWGVL